MGDILDLYFYNYMACSDCIEVGSLCQREGKGKVWKAVKNK